MELRESGEMYLEAIYVLRKTNPNVRSIDIANYTGYSRPSVSRAVGILKEGQHIVVDDDGFITLTDKGEDVASNIYEKHVVLSDLFKKMGVDSDLAVQDACKIEHVLSDETFEAIKKYAGIFQGLLDEKRELEEEESKIS